MPSTRKDALSGAGVMKVRDLAEWLSQHDPDSYFAIELFIDGGVHSWWRYSPDLDIVLTGPNEDADGIGGVGVPCISVEMSDYTPPVVRDPRTLDTPSAYF